MNYKIKTLKFVYLLLPVCVIVLLSSVLVLYLMNLAFDNSTDYEALFSETSLVYPSRVYSQDHLVRRGDFMTLEALQSRLNDLNYVENQALESAGHFSIKGQKIQINLKHKLKLYQPLLIEITIDEGVVRSIVDVNKRIYFNEIPLTQTLLAIYFDDYLTAREHVPLEHVPPYLIDCLLIAEDQAFYQHDGFDPFGIARAILTNIQTGDYSQGASTLTQQLVRNLALHRRRTLDRKFREVVLAYQIENILSKEEILEKYINTIYFGQDGSINLFGFQEAAIYYFGKNVSELDVSESATLVAIISAPNLINPLVNPEKVLTKRNHILRKLFLDSKISEEVYLAANKSPLPTETYPIKQRLPQVAQSVKALLKDQWNVDEFYAKGYKILSTLDLNLQQKAIEAIQSRLTQIEAANNQIKSDSLQAALVCLDAKTGKILAMVGDRANQQDSLNRAIQTKRQIGSLIKPFIYLYAFDQAHPNNKLWHPSDMVVDEPVTYQTDTETWSPKNYNARYHGPVTLRRALEQSYNIPTVKLAHEVGLSNFAEYLNQSNITKIKPYHSLALGIEELTPLEVAALYSAFATDGNIMYPYMVDSIFDLEGNKVYGSIAQRYTLATSQATFQVKSILEGVFQRGTAKSAKNLGWTKHAIGKTGTTNQYHDSWFAGITSDYITVVWVGYDQPESTGLTGSEGALPVWVDFMNAVYGDDQPQPIQAPPGLAKVYVNYETGKISYTKLDNTVEEYLLLDSLSNDALTKHNQNLISQSEVARQIEPTPTPTIVQNTPQPTPSPPVPPTSTAVATNTNTPLGSEPTNTPLPEPTATSVPTNTFTPVSTSTPVPTATSTPTLVPSPTPVSVAENDIAELERKAKQTIDGFLKKIAQPEKK